MQFSTATSDEVIALTRSQYAERTLQWDLKPYSLRDYPMFNAIYNGSFQSLLLKTCRQVGKSMTLAAFAISECVAIPGFRTFFIAPTQEQTRTFSSDRVGKFLHFSPLIRDNFLDNSLPNRVLQRSFMSGSQIKFSYASDDADRCRGNSADRIMFDEVQDMLLDVIRPVVNETLRSSNYEYEIYCGTPKTLENGIEHMWQSSTQTEWAIKCDSCGRHSFLLSETQCGKMGPVCTKCQAYLNPRNGQWVDLNRQPPDEDGDSNQYKGFHISRLMMPQNVPAAWAPGTEEWKRALRKWKSVLGALSGPKAYPIATFRNEVLGISDSQGTRLVTKAMLAAMADGPPICAKPSNANMQGVTKISAGLDWSGGGSAQATKDGGVVIKSRTVLVILGKLGIGRTRLLYFKIFPGTGPVEEIEEIIEVLTAYDRWAQNMMFIGADAGVGSMQIDMIRKRMPKPQRVHKFFYSGSYGGYTGWSQKKQARILHRTKAIDAIMTAFIRGEFQWPKEPELIMEEAYSDILAEFETIVGGVEAQRKLWDHAPNKPDDFLHGMVFGRTALQLACNELDLTSHINPDLEAD